MDIKGSICTSVGLLIAVFVFFNQDVDAQKSISSLIKKFNSLPFRLNKYDTPVSGSENVIPVNISLLISHIHHLNENLGAVVLEGWLTLIWTNDRYTWNSTDYERNQSIVHLIASHFWRPTVTVDSELEIYISPSYLSQSVDIAVHSNGKLVWRFPHTFSVTCTIDHRKFPFDEHVCDVKIRVIDRIENYTRIVLHKISANHHHHNDEEDETTQNFIPNPLWTVTKINTQIAHKGKHKHVSHHDMYHCSVHLRRHSPGQKFIILMPSILAIGMTLALFWLPPASGQKITLGGITVMIFLALLLYLGWKIPGGGQHMPSIVLFCGISLMMSGQSLIISVIGLHLSKSNNYRPMPRFLKSALNHKVSQVLRINFANPQIEDGVLLSNNSEVPAEEQSPDIPTQYRANEANWTLLAIAIDRICFAIYCFVFIILLSSFSF